MQLHTREMEKVKMSKIMSIFFENNSTSVLCLPDGAALVNSVWSPGWTVEDQDVLSRFISYLVAALSAEVYIGVQSLHTSSVGSVQVGESDFEFDLAVFLLWVLLFQSIQYGDVRVVGQYRGLFVAPDRYLAQRCTIDQDGGRVAGEYGLVVSFGSGGPDIGAAQVLPTYLALRSQHGYARLR